MSKLKALWQRKPDPQPRPAVTLDSLFDRDPPHSPEAEMALLGSVILDPRRLAEVGPVIGNGEAFYQDRHKLIWRTLVSAVERFGQDADLVPVADRLRQMGDLKSVGGPEYLCELAESVPSAVNAMHYARIMLGSWRRRRVIVACGEAIYEAFHNDDAKAVCRSALSGIAAAAGGAP